MHTDTRPPCISNLNGPASEPLLHVPFAQPGKLLPALPKRPPAQMLPVK